MDNPHPKKPFRDPKLVVYGGIQDLTASIGRVGADDVGGHGNKDKTR